MINSSKLAPLKSSKALFQQPDFDFSQLQSSLKRENKKQKVEQSEPLIIIPDFQKTPVEDKLWKFFVSRVECTKQKVEKERVNVWMREMDSISNEVIKKTLANKTRLLSYQTLLQSKHRQIHDLFHEIRLSSLSLKDSMRKEDGFIATKNQSQTAFLQKEIDILKTQIDDLSKQQDNTQQQLEKINREYISFLCQLLKHQYYRQDGIVWILHQLLDFGHDTKHKELPSVLSKEAKDYLLKTAQAAHKQKGARNKQVIVRERDGSQRALGRALSLLQPNQLKKVYSKAQDCMGELVRQPAWRDTLTLPRLCPQPQNAEEHSVPHSAACKMLLQSYLDKEAQRRARALLIGPKTSLLP